MKMPRGWKPERPVLIPRIVMDAISNASVANHGENKTHEHAYLDIAEEECQRLLKMIQSRRAWLIRNGIVPDHQTEAEAQRPANAPEGRWSRF